MSSHYFYADEISRKKIRGKERIRESYQLFVILYLYLIALSMRYVNNDEEKAVEDCYSKNHSTRVVTEKPFHTIPLYGKSTKKPGNAT